MYKKCSMLFVPLLLVTMKACSLQDESLWKFTYKMLHNAFYYINISIMFGLH